MEKQNYNAVRNVFIFTFIVVIAIFFLHPKNLYATGVETPTWCSGQTLTLYSNPLGNTNLSNYSGGGIVPPQVGINTSSSSCNTSLFTNVTSVGFCPLSKNLKSIYYQVGTLMNIPPAYLAAEKQQESDVNCYFDQNSQGGSSITDIEEILYSDPSAHYRSFGPFQFLPSTWAEYANQVVSIMQKNYPNVYQNIGINQDNFLESMIGAAVYLTNDSPVAITSESSWTTQAMLIASARYNAGGNYTIPRAQAYALSVNAIYNSLSKECVFS